MSRKHRLLYEDMRRFALRYMEHGIIGTYRCSSRQDEIDRDIDDLLESIEDVKLIEGAHGAETDQTGEKSGQMEEERRDIKKSLLESMGHILPYTMLTPHLRRISDALNKSAHADLVRAIVACERMIAENPGMDLEGGNRLIEYKQRLKELEASHVVDLEKCEKTALTETLKTLARCNLSEEQGVFKIYLTQAYFQELMNAVEKVGGDMSSWCAFFESAVERLGAEDKARAEK